MRIAPGTGPSQRVELSLAVGGMTCGACAARVERVLNDLEGVVARVNYATERATATVSLGIPARRLIDEVASAGYRAELIDEEQAARPAPSGHDRRLRSLRWRLLVAAALFMPLCDYSFAFSAHPSTGASGWQWFMVALAAPVLIWSGWPFYQSALRNARHRTSTMDTLVSIGILAATAWSLYTMFVLDTGHHRHPGGGIYLDVPCGVILFLLAGRYFETWSRKRSGDALRGLASVAAREVTILHATGREERRPVAELAVGQRFLVRPGETVATDGEVLLGTSSLDQSAMTGEAEPGEASAGDHVLGGTISLTGRIVVRATRVGRDTQLGQMLRLVEHAQGEKAAVQRFADRISSVFVPAVLVIAAGTLSAWLLSGSTTTKAFGAAISVLTIACPCALGLATPAALFVASLTGANRGIFFKGYQALEASRQIDTILLDKTGTLTQGAMTLTDLEVVPGVQEDDVLRWAGALERASEHPVARAIAGEAARRLGDDLPEADDFAALPGMGVRGTVQGHELFVGRAAPGMLPAGLAKRCREWESMARTAVVVCCDDAVIAAVGVADAIRPSAAPAVRQLQALGLRCMLVTGDNELTARAVAAVLGIEEVVAGALPTDKVALIHRLQGEGGRVAMMGDGVNDAPALASADLGLAVGSGTDVAINAADLIIVRDDLRVAATAIGLARRTLRTIRGNLTWAFLYNVAAIPVAAAGLLNPLVAAAAMGLSSSFVVANSSRLLRQPGTRSAPEARRVSMPRRRPALSTEESG